jgi:drug/metabolite transporter (DMT)-like permease
MNMNNGLWLLFCSFIVVGSVVFNVGMKLGTAEVNPFGFMFFMNVFAVAAFGLCCLVAIYGFKVDVMKGMNLPAFNYAALCAASVVIIDIGYIMAVRYGSLIGTQVIWTVGGMVAFAAIAVLFLNETMTLTKALGIAFGVVSVLLITKAS